jgi:hypothetical protein
VVEISPFVVTNSNDDERVEESTSGTLVSRPLDKLPMGISVVSAELMKQLDILNADTLNRVVPGLANQNKVRVTIRSMPPAASPCCRDATASPRAVACTT